MDPWYLQVLFALITRGVTSVKEIIELGKSAGMTDEQAAAMTADFDARIARREEAARGPATR